MIGQLFNIMGTFLCSVVYDRNFTILTDSPYKFNKRKKFILLIFSLLVYLCRNYLHSYFQVVVTFFITYTMFQAIYKKEINISLFSTLIITVFSIFIDILLVLSLTLFVGDINSINNFWVVSLLSLSELIILYFSFSVERLVLCLKKLGNYFSKKIDSQVAIIALVTIASIMSVKYQRELNNYSFITWGLIIFSISFFLLVMVIKEKYKKDLLTIKTNYLQENLSQYEQMLEDYRLLKHNLTNDLIVISSFSSKRNQKIIIEKLNQYQKNYEWINSISKIPEGLKGMIYLKKQEAIKKGIKFIFNSEINDDLTKAVSPKMYNALCDSVGIILDNAIEAALLCEEKTIIVNCYKIDKELLVYVLNTYVNNIDVDRIETKYFTSKKNNQGLGLDYINKLQSKKFRVKRVIQNEYFKTSIHIPIK